MRENLIQIKRPKKQLTSKMHTHTIQQWELWGMCLIVIKWSKTFLDISWVKCDLDMFSWKLGKACPCTCNLKANTDILACVWRSYTSSRWESPPAPADTGQWEWKPQPEEQLSSSPSLCLPPSQHETPDCCYSPLIRETRAKLSLTHPLINDLIDKHIIRYITQYSAHSRSYKNTTK